ncbi:unnamed protein product [Caenorhabditis brenneri]
MGAKDSKPRSLEVSLGLDFVSVNHFFQEQKILIHGLSKVFGAFIRGIRSSIGVENFPAVLKFMLKTCYTKNHDEFCFAVFPCIQKLIDEMERSEHLEISTEDRKSKKQCVIKVKFNYPDEFYSDYLALKTLRSPKQGTETQSDPTPSFPEPAERTMTEVDSESKKMEKDLNLPIKTDLEMTDDYDLSSDLDREIPDLNQTVPVPITDFQTEGCAQKVDPRSTEPEKVRERFPWNNISGSKRYPEMRATWNSVFYDQEPFSRDPSYDTVETLLPGVLDTSSAGEEIEDPPKTLSPQNLMLEPDSIDTLSVDLDEASSSLKKLGNYELDNPLPTQPSSSYIGYEDKFASMERISQEELAMKLAEQARYYEEKLKTMQRIRRERNEDAQEEIRSIKESQNERRRLFHQK